MQVLGPHFSLFCWENGLSSNIYSNRIDVWNSGIQQQTNALNAAGWMWSSTTSTMTLAELVIEAVESGGLEQLTPQQKWPYGIGSKPVRNRLPIVDHALVADAEATDLAGTYCFSSLTRFLVRVLQLSPGEAASRVRAAAAVGPRTSMLGEKLQPVLPRLAVLQRDGDVSTEKVQIVAQAMQKLTRAGLNPEAVDTAEQLLSDYAPMLGPSDLRRYALTCGRRC